MMNNDDSKLLQTVHDQYAAVARSSLSNDTDAVRTVAAAFGYTEEGDPIASGRSEHGTLMW